MNAQDVAHYLQSNPDFFETHAELLASIQLTSPHSHRAVSLQERQMEILREKNKGLELRLADLMRFGHENDRTQQRLHTWLVRLLGETDTHALPYTVIDGLREIFEVPAVSLRLWNTAEAYHHIEVAREVSEDVRVFAGGLRTPYCGANAGFEAVQWLAQDDIQSVAMVALRAPQSVGAEPEATFGLLILGSSDPRRFHEGMGTVYLTQLGDLASAALNRLRT
ncbi:MAG TPA: DUF484 family protein [Burkholderiaceae bacterium]|nr:DUF484 family protein [Burkholderiaceae bacterium]